jgi:hypothetical protein
MTACLKRLRVLLLQDKLTHSPYFDIIWPTGLSSAYSATKLRHLWLPNSLEFDTKYNEFYALAATSLMSMNGKYITLYIRVEENTSVQDCS